MWEEGLGICYSLVSCLAKCEHFSGAIIHATKLPTSDLLIEKVSYSLFNLIRTFSSMHRLINQLTHM